MLVNAENIYQLKHDLQLVYLSVCDIYELIRGKILDGSQYFDENISVNINCFVLAQLNNALQLSFIIAKEYLA
jgi:hypothetical protein